MKAKIEALIEEYQRVLGIQPSFSLDIHPDDFIFHFLYTHPCFEQKLDAIKYYFEDGQNSADALGALLFERLSFSDRGDFSLLEFASGYGCVSRHLRERIPNAKITSSDIHAEANKFISERMHLPTIQSFSDPECYPEDQSFDAIFALSFFSHMPRSTWEKWLRKLYSLLNRGGYLIFTTQGMASRKHFHYPEIPEDGFWFSAENSEQKDLDAAEYGQTIVTAEFVLGTLNQLFRGPFILMRPAFWWGHQDLYVVPKERSLSMAPGQ